MLPTAANAQPGDVITGIPALCHGQQAHVVKVEKVLRDIRLTPQVVLHVELPGQFGVWEHRVDADTELALVNVADNLADRLGEVLAEMVR